MWTKQDFSKRLKTAHAGRKQLDLAERCCVSEGMISAYLSGRSWPSTKVLGLLSKHLDVSADYLLGLTAQPTLAKEPVESLSDLRGASEDPRMVPNLLDQIGELKAQLKAAELASNGQGNIRHGAENVRARRAEEREDDDRRRPQIPDDLLRALDGESPATPQGLERTQEWLDQRKKAKQINPKGRRRH